MYIIYSYTVLCIHICRCVSFWKQVAGFFFHHNGLSRAWQNFFCAEPQSETAKLWCTTALCGIGSPPPPIWALLTQLGRIGNEICRRRRTTSWTTALLHFTCCSNLLPRRLKAVPIQGGWRPSCQPANHFFRQISDALGYFFSFQQGSGVKASLLVDSSIPFSMF